MKILYLKIVGLVMLFPLIPLWKHLTMYWSAYFMVKYGWIDNYEDAVQLDLVKAVAFFFFLTPYVLYPLYVIYSMADYYANQSEN